MRHQDPASVIPSAQPGVASKDDDAVLERLIPVVYDELRSMAHRRLRNEREGHTLNTTGLVHEAWIKLADHPPGFDIARGQLFGLAARAMQQVLIDSARRHGTGRRGHGWQRITLDEATATVAERADALLALDEALDRLSAVSTRMSAVVRCRFFGGLTEAETAVALDVSERTVRREWVKAKLWLYDELVTANATDAADAADATVPEAEAS